MYRDQPSPGLPLARGDRGTYMGLCPDYQMQQFAPASSELKQRRLQLRSAASPYLQLLRTHATRAEPPVSSCPRSASAILHDASATAPTMPPSTPSQADLQSRDGAAEGPDPRVGQACLACRRKKVAQVKPISRRDAHSLTRLRSNATGSSRATSAVLASRTASIPGAGTMHRPVDSMRTPVEPVG